MHNESNKKLDTINLSERNLQKERNVANSRLSARSNKIDNSTISLDKNK